MAGSDRKGDNFSCRVNEDFARVLQGDALTSVLNAVAEQTRSLIGAHQSLICYIPNGDFSRITKSTSMSDKYVDYRGYDVMPGNVDVWKQIFESGKSMCLTKKELYSYPAFRNFFTSITQKNMGHLSVSGWLAALVRRPNGEPVGILQVSDKYDGDFTQKDQQLLEYLATLISATFELEYSKEKLEARVLELSLVFRGTSIVSKTRVFEEALQKCIALVCELIKWPIGHVYLMNDSKKELFPSNIWCISDPENLQKFVDVTYKTTCKKGYGLPGSVWEKEKPIWISDLGSEYHGLREKAYNDLQLCSAIGFPILADGKLIAVCEFFSHNCESKNESLLNTFQVLGDQIGYLFEKKQTEKQLENLAHYDSITGLPNRVYFQETLRHAILKAKRFRKYLALLYLDLDNFKTVNDTCGHETGDELLRYVAYSIKENAREIDFVARLGGDEFIVLIEELKAPSDAMRLAKAILGQFQSSILLHNHEIFCTMSIGIAVYPTAGECVDELMKHADIAMYRSKSLGKNTVQFFSDELNEVYQKRSAIEFQLRHAVSNNELGLVFQPLVTLPEGNVYGLEALVRWNNSALGQIGPAEFIPIAEEIGMINPIGRWVFEQACEQFMRWNENYRSLNLVLSVNISVLQLTQNNLADFIDEKLKKFDIDPKQLVFELTETVLMQNIESSAEFINTLNELGINFVIDDFGTGYSSFFYLKQLPFAALKIDQSFVRDVTKDADDAKIVRAITELGNILGIDVIAEGVETAEQYQFLNSIKCKYAQGYYFSHPLSATKVTEFLKKHWKEK